MRAGGAPTDFSGFTMINCLWDQNQTGVCSMKLNLPTFKPMNFKITHKGKLNLQSMPNPQKQWKSQLELNW